MTRAEGQTSAEQLGAELAEHEETRAALKLAYEDRRLALYEWQKKQRRARRARVS